MFSRIRPLIAVAASLTLCLLALANPVAAQDVHHGRDGSEPHNAARLRGNSARPAAEGPHGLRAPMAMRRDAVSGYGLHASGPLALTPSAHEGSRLSGSALNTAPVRAGSLRADIARYNAERSGRGVSTQGGMDVPHPPSSYSSNLYTN